MLHIGYITSALNPMHVPGRLRNLSSCNLVLHCCEAAFAESEVAVVLLRSLQHGFAG